MVNTVTKSVYLASCLIAIMAAVYLHASLHHTATFIDIDTMREYTAWRVVYRSGLSTTPAEHGYRLQMFAGNKIDVRRRNEEYDRRVVEEKLPQPKGPMYEMNQFADLSEEEFISQYTGSLESEDESEVSPLSELYESMPRSSPKMDSNLGITHTYNVYNQGGCGSCWAFATVNLAERKWFNKSGVKRQFSQQQLVDCEKSSNGCSGGL